MAHDEADTLRGCLDSVKGIASEIVVVDAESRDDTPNVARAYTDTVISAPNRLGVDATKNIGLQAASYDWVLILDPDERVSLELAKEIIRTIERSPAHVGFFIPRRNYELGRWIRTMGHYPGLQLRLVRRGYGRYAEDRLHQHLIVEGTTGVLTKDLLHFPSPDIRDYAAKRNFYSEHAARRRFESGMEFQLRGLLVRPVLEFIRQYVLLFGWLDGVPGFLIAAHGAYGRFLTHAKLWQLWARARVGRSAYEANDATKLDFRPNVADDPSYPVAPTAGER